MDEKELIDRLEGIRRLIEGNSLEHCGVKSELGAVHQRIGAIDESVQELKRIVRGVNGNLGMLGDVAALKAAENERKDEEKYHRRLRWAQIASVLMSVAAILVSLILALRK